MTKPRIVFVHGLDGYGAGAWPRQHLLAGHFDALFLRRSGFDAQLPPSVSSPEADTQILIQALGQGGFVVAHDQGAISAMMAAVERPDLVKALVLIEPTVPSLTSDLPATLAYREHLEPLFARRSQMAVNEFASEYVRITGAPASRPAVAGLGLANNGPLESAERTAQRLYLQEPPWQAPLEIVPGVPTLVLTGGWEPLYEEIANYLRGTGAHQQVLSGGHRPQDTQEGASVIEAFLLSQSAVASGGSQG